MDIQGLTQVPLARRAHCSQSTINRVINSANAPNFTTLESIAVALNVPTEVLTYPDDKISDIIYQLSRMTSNEIDQVRDYIDKERAWKQHMAAERIMPYGKASKEG